MWMLLVAFVAAFMVALAVVRSTKRLERLAGDSDLSGLQNLHKRPMPRIGGKGMLVGVANAVNIIDGFSGLASMCAALMLAGLAYVAFLLGDLPIAWLALVNAAAPAGFFVWNLPAGLVFLGDGGAYLSAGLRGLERRAT